MTRVLLFPNLPMGIMIEKDLARSCVFAKIGELVQGKLTPTEDFIIPGITSSKFCTKTFIYKTEEKSTFDVREFVFPAVFIYLQLINGVSLDDISKKDIQDIGVVKDYVYKNLKNISVVQHSNIPQGKGLSAGPVDIMGMLLALNKFYNTKYDANTLYKICSKVVPTDPVLDKSVSMIFNPLTGEKVFHLIPKPFGVIYFDTDSESSYDANEVFAKFEYTSSDYVAFNEILELFQNGSMLNDNAMVYKAITMSAKINQSALPKPKFDTLVEFAEANSMGVFVGHTGTVMGLVMDSSLIEGVFDEVSEFVKKEWDSRAYYDFCEQSVIKLT